MKTIYNIAKTELKSLFYSPIAWLIIIIFTFQTALLFTGLFGEKVNYQANNQYIYRATYTVFSGHLGLFTGVLQYLYLYIPLLTMGVFSREYSSGSIKLLYSSPLTTAQIVLGKYLALIFFSFALIGVLSLYCIFGVITINGVEVGMLLSGMLGIFLLMAAYAAIGSFMSSLTSYTVVSAMGTLSIFALLSYVGGIGQDIEFVRDITYWLSISGRAETFIVGMITTEDLAYFIIVICMFITFTLIKLGAERKKVKKTNLVLKYAVVVVLACGCGYLTSLPKFKKYVDVTNTKSNTLTKSSQDVVKQLDDDLIITTYVNMFEDDYWLGLPRLYKENVKKFEKYLRFKPNIKMDFVYYYHELDKSEILNAFPNVPYDKLMDSLKRINNYTFPILSYNEVKKETDLSAENFRYVHELKRANGKTSYLRMFDDMSRFPSEAEITAAFKRLTIGKLPTVGFITGHNERGSASEDDRGYNMFAQEKRFRYSLINQGFDFEDVVLTKPIPAYVRILLLAEPRKEFSEIELRNLESYIAAGGNMLITGEPEGQRYLNPILKPLGVEYLPGIMVSPSEKYSATFLMLKATSQGKDLAYQIKSLAKRKQVVLFQGAGPLSIIDTTQFQARTLFTTDSLASWNELETKNFLDDSVKYNPLAGELKKPHATVIALNRKVKDKEQKILITSDADWLSNAELMLSRKDLESGNFNLFNAAFYWLSDEELPIDMRRPPFTDDSLSISQGTWSVFKILFNWVMVITIGGFASVLLLRRKGR